MQAETEQKHDWHTCKGGAFQSQADEELPQLIIPLHLYKLYGLHNMHRRISALKVFVANHLLYILSPLV